MSEATQKELFPLTPSQFLNYIKTQPSDRVYNGSDIWQ